MFNSNGASILQEQNELLALAERALVCAFRNGGSTELWRRVERFLNRLVNRAVKERFIDTAATLRNVAAQVDRAARQPDREMCRLRSSGFGALHSQEGDRDQRLETNKRREF